MDLYYNDLKLLAKIPIVGATTVGEVKTNINNWLAPQGITNYTIKITLNNGTIIPETVFQTNSYDGVNFQAQLHLLTGGSIQVTNTPPTIQQQPTTIQVTQPTIQQPLEKAEVKTAGAEYTEDALKKLTVPKLKSILRKKGLKVGGKKAELITRILLNPWPEGETPPDYPIGTLLFRRISRDYKFYQVISHTDSGVPRVKELKQIILKTINQDKWEVGPGNVFINPEGKGYLLKWSRKDLKWTFGNPVDIYDPNKKYIYVFYD